VAGFGIITEFGVESRERLKYATMKVKSRKDCEKPDVKKYYTPDKLCAADNSKYYWD